MRPSPVEYKIPSGFQKWAKSRAYTFGISREFFSKVYLRENPPKDPCVPGPGKYLVKRESIERSPSRYSLSRKTIKDCSFQNIHKFVPGPGTYTTSGSDSKKGFIMNARYKSNRNAVISPGKDRFGVNRTALQVPGPGNYNLKLDLNKTGNYHLARYKNSGARCFSRASRDTNLDTSVTRKSNFYHN